ncbi:hypothetical protein FMM68_07355 [Lachnospiraceae bacterium MD329]|nr:hypothetical protein [Lachnospiraceae bacterium MD329]
MAKKPTKPHTKKFRTMAISILFAIVVWFAVIYVNDPDITTTISDLDIKIIGETALREKNLAVTGRADIPPLSVVVTGKRSDLIGFMDDIYVQVDVNEIKATGEYKLSGTISLPTTRVTVEKENYGDIPLRVEKLESRDIEVKLKQTGTLKNKLVKSQITNPKVTVTGASSEISNVHGAVATLDISNMTTDRSDRVTYLLTDEAGELINTNETLESTHSFVDVDSTVYEAKTLPVEPALTAELEKNYILNKEKTVAAPSAVTVGVSSGNTAERLIARIDKLDDSGNGNYRIEPQEGIYIPPESEWIKIKTDAAEKISAETELNVEPENTPEGHTAQVLNPVRVLVKGDANSIKPENLRATVDLSGLSGGEHILPVRLDSDNAVLESEYTVTVIIN